MLQRSNSCSSRITTSLCRAPQHICARTTSSLHNEYEHCKSKSLLLLPNRMILLIPMCRMPSQHQITLSIYSCSAMSFLHTSSIGFCFNSCPLFASYYSFSSSQYCRVSAFQMFIRTPRPTSKAATCPISLLNQPPHSSSAAIPSEALVSLFLQGC